MRTLIDSQTPVLELGRARLLLGITRRQAEAR